MECITFSKITADAYTNYVNLKLTLNLSMFINNLLLSFIPFIYGSPFDQVQVRYVDNLCRYRSASLVRQWPLILIRSKLQTLFSGHFSGSLSSLFVFSVFGVTSVYFIFVGHSSVLYLSYLLLIRLCSFRSSPFPVHIAIFIFYQDLPYVNKSLFFFIFHYKLFFFNLISILIPQTSVSLSPLSQRSFPSRKTFQRGGDSLAVTLVFDSLFYCVESGSIDIFSANLESENITITYHVKVTVVV